MTTTELTRDVAATHVNSITKALKAHEDVIAAMPDGVDKTKLSRTITVLHNCLGQGGAVLNQHFSDATVSPDSSGGDKNNSVAA